MATFTTSEKRQIRAYLGYSGAYRDQGVALESVMDTIANQVDEAAYARELLVQIKAVDDALIASGSSGSSATYGALKKVDEIEFHAPVVGGGGASAILAGVKLGEVLIERLRALFGCDLAGRYFRNGPVSQFHFGPGVG